MAALDNNCINGVGANVGDAEDLTNGSTGQ